MGSDADAVAGRVDGGDDVTEAEQERARIVSLIRATEAEYAREAARLRCGSRRDPRWDDWARAVHKRSMARVLALKIERGE